MLDGLNELQKIVVLSDEGPLLVVAGPGTGKTKTLTHRIAYLIKEKEIPTEKILAITFTRRAAREMKDRLKALLDVGTAGIAVDTLHSLCLRILRKDIQRLGRSPDFSIISEDEKEEVHDGGERSNLLNFDDLISLTIVLFEKHPDTLEEYRKSYPYLFVDEYQDIDDDQRHLITLLVKRSGNICAIGDPDQAIYSFRGANVGNFLRFEKDYPGTRAIKFRLNYRSVSVIVNASSEVIKKNSLRIDKPIEAQRNGKDRIQVYSVPDEKYEGRFIVSEIENLIGATSHYNLYKKGGGKPSSERDFCFSDFAVLFRLNAQIRKIEEAFKESGMPYQTVGGRSSIFREEVRTALSYLHVIDHPQEDWHILRVLNTPNRHLGPQAVAEIREKGRDLNISSYELISKHRDSLSLNRLQKERLGAFTDMIDRLRREMKDLNVSTLVKRVVIDTGLLDFHEGREDFSELITMAVQYDDGPREHALRSFLDDTELSSDIDSFDERSDAVSLMTIHASKGLEFRVVFICGAEDGLIPYTLYSKGQGERIKDREAEIMNIEEERRLFYVGMTRAKDRLYLINAHERYLFGGRISLPQSPFVSDIPEDLKEVYNIRQEVPKKGVATKGEKQLRLF